MQKEPLKFKIINYHLKITKKSLIILILKSQILTITIKIKLYISLQITEIQKKIGYN